MRQVATLSLSALSTGLGRNFCPGPENATLGFDKVNKREREAGDAENLGGGGDPVENKTTWEQVTVIVNSRS